jgi:hypothetical protein
MAGPIYATEADVYRAAPPGTLEYGARAVASVDVTSNRLEVAGHACGLDMPVQLGVDGLALLPAPLSSSAVYYVRPVDGSSSLLELAATPGGAAIDITTPGSGSIRFIVQVSLLLSSLRETYSRAVEDMVIAHEVPFTAPYPPQAVNYVAIMTAWQAAIALGRGGQADRLKELKEEAVIVALRWAKGQPMRTGATGPANLATGRTPAGTRDRDVIP